MLFSSSVFLFLFLPVVLLVYYLPLRRWRQGQNVFLLLASLGFYAWGEPWFVLVMLGSILANYGFGLWVDACKRAGRTCAPPLVTALAVNLGILFVFKYLTFTLGILNRLGATFAIPGIELPIGISFFTFQGLSYVIDVYREDAPPQKNPLNVALYVSLFPQLVAGPIVRYTTVMEDITGRKETLDEFAAGVTRFCFGLAKKMVIANTMGLIADGVFNQTAANLDPGLAWVGALAYTFQIYFDFSAYSDMAIGLGLMFGFHFLENFNYPYISKSVTEFWRRWHISLSTWFRDYVYIPLGGNRCAKWKHVRNITVVWLLTGLWHGASWNFVLWGGYYAALLILEKCWLLKAGEKLPLVLRRMMTMVLVMLGWSLFYFENLGALGAFLGRLFTAVPSAGIAFYLPVTALGCLCATPALKRVKLPDAVRWGLCVVLLLLCVASLARQSYNPFIYFRF